MDALMEKKKRKSPESEFLKEKFDHKYPPRIYRILTIKNQIIMKNTYPLDDKFFENEEFQEAMNAFSETRKKKRAPLTEYALKLILKKLHELSEDNVDAAIKMVQQSVEMGWQGIFPLRDEQNKPEEFTRKRTEA